jgi:hypothetical protein
MVCFGVVYFRHLRAIDDKTNTIMMITAARHSAIKWRSKLNLKKIKNGLEFKLAAVEEAVKLIGMPA